MATFVRIVLPLFVLAAAGLVWFLLDGGQPRAERVEPAPRAEVRPEPGPDAAPPPGAATPRVVPPVPIPAEHLAPPLDGVEKGPGALILHVVDRDTGEKVRANVQLWRLDAPANLRWTRGDQLQAVRPAPNGDVRFDDLPPGRYRAVVDEERAAAAGGHEVEVGDDVAEATIHVAPAREWPVRLRVVWDDGERVERGRGGMGNAWCVVKPAEWPGKVERKRLDGVPVERPVEPDRIGMEVSVLAPRELRDEGGGVLLGTVREETKGGRWSRVLRFEPEGCVPVLFTATGDLDGERRYAAPAVPLAPVIEAVRMPDGTPAVAAGATVEASVGAIELRNEADEAGVWRLEVRLQATRYGFQPVDARFPADRRPPTIYLERTE